MMPRVGKTADAARLAIPQLYKNSKASAVVE